MTCDPWQALIPAEHGTGCTVRVQVGIADSWQAVGLIAGVLVVMLLVALLVAQVRR